MKCPVCGKLIGEGPVNMASHLQLTHEGCPCGYDRFGIPYTPLKQHLILIDYENREKWIEHLVTAALSKGVS